MAGLLSPKPVSYLQQQNSMALGHYPSPYSQRSLPSALAYPASDSPAPQGQYSQHMQYLAGYDQGEHSSIFQLVKELMDPNARETALLELSKKREQYDDLALVLWHSFGEWGALTREAEWCADKLIRQE